MLRIVNPATESVIREVSPDTADTVRDKLAAAKAAQPSWGARPLSDRIAIIRRFGDLVAQNKDRLAATTTSEMGKPITQSRNEINGLAPRIEFFTQAVGDVMAARTVWCDPLDRIREVIAFDPLGVIAHVSPWNYPYFVAANVYLPALLTGNAVLYKPSEFATLTGLAITELLQEAGVPSEIFTPVIGAGDVGASLVGAAVDGVFFTGSVATGRLVGAAAARSFVKVQLELGGKDPVYVCEDADFTSAVKGIADGAFYNTGQSCCSVERIYVHEKLHDKFVDAFLTEVKGYVMGDPADEKTYLGPLARKAQLDILDAQVKDAVAKGARLLCGGKRATRPGFYFEPAVLTDVTHAMAIQREESFGPVIGIQRVKDDAEAVRLMNDTEFGLTAAVYTADRPRAETILSQVQAGSAYWNCCDRVSPRLPWSGRRHSGLGSTLSTLGIQAFLQPKAWHFRGPTG